MAFLAGSRTLKSRWKFDYSVESNPGILKTEIIVEDSILHRASDIITTKRISDDNHLPYITAQLTSRQPQEHFLALEIFQPRFTSEFFLLFHPHRCVYRTEHIHNCHPLSIDSRPVNSYTPRQ
ncbi:hypothetical protein Moror_8191 [Moniliophthora roreri MCA 2997]|uniref:Uncharacterized protein n=1 Tax=Moniliophthora roreri (strain MCA 2997) TaxID=1381753 RepID=V2XNA0_MONRO|nr:hypothetical protein Moror_8191 [Moniliophthora roreri MCA 2997]